MIVRPFFCMYGGKWRAAPRYPMPKYDTIIEPFSGGAGYSLRNYEHQVILFDKDPNIYRVWQYLVNVSPEEILGLPNVSEEQSVDDLTVCEEAKLLIGWWLNYGSSAPRKHPCKDMLYGVRSDTSKYAVFWGVKARKRIASQLSCIRHWSVLPGDYHSAPDVEATWFIDPPYQRGGEHYRMGSSDIDYELLGEWCRSRQGQVIVCERSGADWLPFQDFLVCKANESGRSRHQIHEALWTNGC